MEQWLLCGYNSFQDITHTFSWHKYRHSAPTTSTHTAHTRVYGSKWRVVLVLALYLRGSNRCRLPSEMAFAHTHTHNFTMIFTSNIEEVMALWAISLSSSAVEVRSRRFKASSYSRNHMADTLIGTRHKDTQLLIRSSMKALLYTYQSLLQIMIYRLQRGRWNETEKVRHEEV